MNKDDIVIGGVYELDREAYVIANKGILFNDYAPEWVAIRDDDTHPHGYVGNWVEDGRQTQVYRIKPEHLIQQIGFDVRYTDDYKALKHRVNAIVAMNETLEDMIETNPLHLSKEHITALSEILQVAWDNIDMLQSKIEKMEQQPIMFEGDSNE